MPDAGLLLMLLLLLLQLLQLLQLPAAGAERCHVSCGMSH
jgi:hypothetical protein